MFLEILNPSTKVYEGEVSYVKVPGFDGVFEVLNNHAPLISVMAPSGEVEIVTNSKERKTFEVGGGVVEVLNNKMTILTEK